MEIKKITIVGMGALGILFGDFFTQKLGKEAVEFVAEEDRIEKYKKNGVICNGRNCDFRVVSASEKDKPADLLIFAVKATTLESALKTANNKVGKDTIIISLLNGISSEKIIGEKFGIEKIIYCVAQGMDAVKVRNKLSYSHIGQLCIGLMKEEEYKKEKLQTLVDLLEKVGIPYTVEDDIKHRIWCKFMLNVGVNQAVMIYEGTYETIQHPGEARDLMTAAMREVIAIAEREDVDVTEKDLEDYVKLIDTLNPNGMPSMRQDGLAHRKSEVEIFSGTVLELGEKYQVATPVNQKIYDRICELERTYYL